MTFSIKQMEMERYYIQSCWFHRHGLCSRHQQSEVHNQMGLHLPWHTNLLGLKEVALCIAVFNGVRMVRSFTSAEGIWLIRLGTDFTHTVTQVPIFTDNKLFLMFVKNNVSNNHTKHIDWHYHYTCNQVEKGNIILHYIPIHYNPTDILTNPLSLHKYAQLLPILNIVVIATPPLSSYK